MNIPLERLECIVGQVDDFGLAGIADQATKLKGDEAMQGGKGLIDHAITMQDVRVVLTVVHRLAKGQR